LADVLLSQSERSLLSYRLGERVEREYRYKYNDNYINLTFLVVSWART